MRNVLKPTYIQLGDWFAIRWVVIGQARDLAHAKALFGGYPVMEA